MSTLQTPLVFLKIRYRYRHSILGSSLNLIRGFYEDSCDVAVFFPLLDFCALSAALGDIGGSGGTTSFERSAFRSLPLRRISIVITRSGSELTSSIF
jgi:hypothetical protein